MDVSAINSGVTPSNAAAQSMEQRINSVRAQLLRGDINDPRVAKALAELNRANGATRSGNINSASVLLRTASKIANDVTPATSQTLSSGTGSKQAKGVEQSPMPKTPQKSSAPKPKENENDATVSYQDSSSDPGASFQYPASMTPAQAELLVPVHENSHIMHEKAKAAMNGQEVVSASVTISRRWDPVAGQFVIVGGQAHIEVREKTKMVFNTLPAGKVRSAYINGSTNNPALDMLG